MKSESDVAQSCPTLCDPMDCSPPGSSDNGIFQARVLEWGAISLCPWTAGHLKYLMAQSAKNLPAKQATQVQSLGQENPLEKEMATHSSILVWKIPWTEEPSGLHSPWGRKRVGHNLGTKPTNQYLLSIHYSPTTPLGI